MGYTPKHAKLDTVDVASKPARALFSITGASTGRHTVTALRRTSAPAVTVTPEPSPAAA
jgi:hypothetical protein